MQRDPVARGQIRHLGLVGGMSWRSTALYYERLNRALETRLGTHASFTGHVRNLNYADLLAMAASGDGVGVEAMLTGAARQLAQAGCEVIALTAVTAHRWYEAVQGGVAADIPHVLEGASRHLSFLDIRSAGVLGTSMTCGAAFMRRYLAGHGRQLLLPGADEQAEIDHLIQDILTTDGDPSCGREILCKAIDRLKGRGAQAIVLACTELPLLLPVAEAEVPLLDCVALHVDEICNRILE